MPWGQKLVLMFCEYPESLFCVVFLLCGFFSFLIVYQLILKNPALVVIFYWEVFQGILSTTLLEMEVFKLYFS